MKTPANTAVALAIGAIMLSATPVGAESWSSEWLHRQFTTDHRAPPALRSTPTERVWSASSSPADVSGHEFAAAWLEQQFTGKPPHAASPARITGRAGPAAAEEATVPLYERWLKRQFSTDHRG